MWVHWRRTQMPTNHPEVLLSGLSCLQHLDWSGSITLHGTQKLNHAFCVYSLQAAFPRSSCLRRHNSYLLLSCCCHLSISRVHTWASLRHRHGAGMVIPAFPPLHTQMSPTPFSLIFCPSGSIHSRQGRLCCSPAQAQDAFGMEMRGW